MNPMKMMTRVGLVAITLSIAASAAPAWTTRGKVINVWAGYGDKSVFVGGLENKVGCANGALIHFTSGTSDPEKVLSIATAAQLSGKTLACAVEGCDAGGYQIGFQCNLQD
jgi:hypothetical protein